ncbi:ParA family protein [Kitasatospora sp. NPDC048545]|uniref:ParA family protein n=1 Tax=Kitasatospora sp. NPDC048545 TaxID=3157208 RepID=UPI0033D38947
MSVALESATAVAARAARRPDDVRPGGARVVVVIQRKGGAGKSTLTVNLAAVSGESNPPADPEGDSPVIALGVDPQGSMEQWARRVAAELLPFDYVVTKGRLGTLPELVKDPAVKRIWVDTPGFIDTDPDADLDGDPLGAGRAGDAMREVLDYADLALVPITTEFLSKDPAEYTIEYVLKPRGIPFMVVINMWDSGSDGKTQKDLKKAEQWCDERGYPRAPRPVRKYKVHSNAAEDGLTVIQYPENGTSLRAREDIYKLALAVERAL